MKFVDEKKAEGIRFLDARIGEAANTALRIKLKDHEPAWYWATSFGWEVMSSKKEIEAEEALREYDGRQEC